MILKRIFAAIDLTDAVRREVGLYTNSLRQAFPGSRVRWEQNEKLHITVRFAGGLNEDELAAFIARVDSAARSIKPFTTAVSCTGSFNRRNRDAVLWLGLRSYRPDGGADPTELLADLLRPATEKPRGHFQPHLTIARLKNPGKCHDLMQMHLNNEFGPVIFEVPELVVYESELLPKGTVYSVVSRHRFGNSSISEPDISR